MVKALSQAAPHLACCIWSLKIQLVEAPDKVNRPVSQGQLVFLREVLVHVSRGELSPLLLLSLVLGSFGFHWFRVLLSHTCRSHRCEIVKVQYFIPRFKKSGNFITVTKDGCLQIWTESFMLISSFRVNRVYPQTGI